MKTKYLIILLLSLYFILPVNSQPPYISSDGGYENAWLDKHSLEKYWHHRSKLREQFVMVGIERGNICNPKYSTGYSIPLHHTDALQWENTSSSDATLVLGWYIAVLATEYQLLKSAKGPNSPEVYFVKKELYYAMKAYERLDIKAEQRLDMAGLDNYDDYDCSENRVLNGFFIRDDFGDETRNAFPFQPFHSHYESDPGCSSNRFATGDQISGLFMGFALVKKLVNDAYIDSESGEIYIFQKKAEDYTHAIAHKLVQDEWDGKFPTNCRCANLPYPHGDFNEECNSYGYAQAASYITRRKYLTITGQEECWLAKHGAPGDLFYNVAWAECHEHAIAHQMLVAAIGDSWPTDALYRRGIQYNMEIFSLLNGVLWGKKWYSYNSRMPNRCYYYMVTAPDDEFLHNPLSDPNNPGTNGWCEWNRWWRPKSAYSGYSECEIIKPPDRESNGRFNGLDYMLLHNLYLLYSSFPENLILDDENNAESKLVPLLFGPNDQAMWDNIGTFNKPLCYYARESITISSSNSDPYTIHENEAIELRSQCIIINKLHVDKGGKLLIDVEPYNYGDGADFSDMY